jgi:hypothetical protein
MTAVAGIFGLMPMVESIDGFVTGLQEKFLMPPV